MIRPPAFVFLFTAFAIAPALGLGCSTDEERSPFNGTPPEEFPPPACDSPTCSADLLSRVDCHGQAVACGPGLGCSKGSCVPACDAALAQESTVGCEYFPIIPSTDLPTAGSCYAVMLANVWNSPVEFELSWDGQKISNSYIRTPRGSGKSLTYDLLPDGKLPPGELAIAFLSARKPAYDPDWEGTICPEDVGSAISEQAWVMSGGRGKAFHLKSSAPIIAYDMYPYGGAATHFPSSSLLFPTSAWGKNYVAVEGYPASPRMISGGFFPYLQIVAAEDNTTVQLLPKNTLGGGPGLDNAPAGLVYSTKLARGEFLQFSQKDDLDGTIVDSDKPIALVGGNQCADIPLNKVACDTLHQQLPSINLMGDVYVATRYRDRRAANDSNLEIVPWRIAGVVDGTELRYDPDVPAAPKTIGRGEVIEFRAPGPFLVRTQDKHHPIYVASYMTAGDEASGHGDPEFVNVTPAGQYLSNYLFLTDPTFGNTNLVFVRDTAQGAKDVNLDCLGPITNWQRVGATTYEMARVDLMFRGQAVGDCANGAHRASSDAPFGLTVWGFDEYASYGYAAGMSAKSLNDVHVPAVQ